MWGEGAKKLFDSQSLWQDKAQANFLQPESTKCGVSSGRRSNGDSKPLAIFYIFLATPRGQGGGFASPLRTMARVLVCCLKLPLRK